MADHISRREFLGKSLVASAALMGLPALALGKGKKGPPNFVFILCDDLGYSDLGYFGSPNIATPRIDQMAREGMKLTSFYSAAPVCTPSRAALMTGCYAQRVSLPRVLGANADVGISAEEITIADVLKKHGYATACIGKWHLGHHKQFLPTRHGFDYYYGLPYSNDMGRERPVPLMRDEEIIEQPVVQETLTERYTQEAIKFITDNKDKPFFLYLPHTFPHVPLHVSDRFKGKSKRGLYGDVVEGIDWSTGQILDTLKKLGLDNNTLVIFTSDNGPWLDKEQDGGSALPLRDGKFSTYEGGMRMPCVARWPRHIHPGSTCTEMATMMDIMPTFAALAGTKPPADRKIDGKDIRPLLTGRGKTPYSAFFYYYRYDLGAVRSGKWKLVLSKKEKTGVRPAELYDLETDISEAHNVADQHPDVVKRLEALAQQCREDLGDDLTGAKGKNVRPCGRI